MVESVFDREKRIRGAKLTMGQTFYLVTLNGFIRNNAAAWPSQKAIAWAMNATKRAVRNWQTELEQIGALQVDVGKGRSATNRYRLNLDALEPKPNEKEELSSALSIDPDNKRGTQFPSNEEHSSAEMRNSVPTERAGKEHKKEQAFSFPEKLNSKEFSDAWSQWTEYRREIKKKLTASTIEKQLAKLAGFGSAKAVRSIELSIENGWLGLFDPDSKSGKANPAASSEALDAWQYVLDSLKLHSRFSPEKIMGDIGQRSWQAIKGFGLKRLEEANDFERRELQKRFVQEFNRQGAAA